MKYRLGRKQNRVILDENGHEVAIFHKGYEDKAVLCCEFLSYISNGSNLKPNY